jgi:hypothetical protein
MFRAEQYEEMYKKFLGPLAQPVTFLVNNGTGFNKYTGVSAHVSKYQERDLVAGGPVQLGDLKLIILSADLPVPTLNQSDRIEIDGRGYSVMHWDVNTRSVGSDNIAVEVRIRG